MLHKDFLVFVTLTVEEFSKWSGSLSVVLYCSLGLTSAFFRPFFLCFYKKMTLYQAFKDYLFMTTIAREYMVCVWEGDVHCHNTHVAVSRQLCGVHSLHL